MTQAVGKVCAMSMGGNETPRCMVERSKRRSRLAELEGSLLRLLDDLMDLFEGRIGLAKESYPRHVRVVTVEVDPDINQDDVPFRQFFLSGSVMGHGAIWTKGDDRIKSHTFAAMPLPEDFEFACAFLFGDSLSEQ